jgi:hypothetical protein
MGKFVACSAKALIMSYVVNFCQLDMPSERSKVCILYRGLTCSFLCNFYASTWTIPIPRWVSATTLTCRSGSGPSRRGDDGLKSEMEVQ